MVGALHKLLHKRGTLTTSWEHDLKAQLLSPPALVDIDGDGKQEILISTMEGDVLCLDQQRTERWRTQVQQRMEPGEEIFYEESSVYSVNTTPTFGMLGASNAILVGTEQGHIVCLETSGRVRWRYACKGPIRNTITVGGVVNDREQQVIAGSSDGYLYVLNPEGELLLKYDAGSPIESIPSVFRQRIIFGTNSGMVHCIDIKGNKIWTYQTKAKITSKAVVANLGKHDRPSLLIASKDNSLYALDDRGGLLWTYETEGAIMSAPAVVDIGHDKDTLIVLGSCDNKVHAINGHGRELWQYETDFWVVAPPVILDIDNNKNLEVAAVSYDHNLYILACEGEYLLDYIPGVSGVVNQSGHYTEVMTQEAGRQVGKRLWQLHSSGVLIGCDRLNERDLLLTTKTGRLLMITHKE